MTLISGFQDLTYATTDRDEFHYHSLEHFGVLMSCILNALPGLPPQSQLQRCLPDDTACPRCRYNNEARTCKTRCWLGLGLGLAWPALIFCCWMLRGFWKAAGPDMHSSSETQVESAHLIKSSPPQVTMAVTCGSSKVMGPDAGLLESMLNALDVGAHQGIDLWKDACLQQCCRFLDLRAHQQISRLSQGHDNGER